MPIRQGVPTALDVTITNAGREALTLERFSLTKDYSDYGRGIGDRGKELVLPDDEIAGRDLGRAVLESGQAHSFELERHVFRGGHSVRLFQRPGFWHVAELGYAPSALAVGIGITAHFFCSEM